MKIIKAILSISFLFWPVGVRATIPDDYFYDYYLASLSVSSLPRLDIFKADIILPHSRVGVGASGIALRYGDWKYSVHKYEYDGWNITSQSFYKDNTKCLVDFFPVSIYFTPYVWQGHYNKATNIRFFYEYASTWVKKDELFSGRCVEADSSGLRTTQDYGIIFDLVGLARFKTGNILMKRAASSCEAMGSGNMYDFGPLNVSKWYAGIELSFGGVSKKNSQTVNLGGFHAGSNVDINDYGFLPLIKGPIIRARIAKENAKPKIISFSPQKPVIGSSFEISGSNFRANENKTEVLFGKFSGEIVGLSDKTIVVRVPGDTKPGNVGFIVRTSVGDSSEKLVFLLPAKPPRLAVSGIKFVDESGDRILSASENGKIIFELSNAVGAGKAFGIVNQTSVSRGGKNINFPALLDVGDLEPGEAVDVELPIKGTLDLETGKETFQIKVSEINDFGLDPFDVKIRTKKLEPPDLQVAKIEVDDKFYPDRAEKLSVGNGNSIVEPGESVEVSATLLNKGTGLTKNTKVKVVSASPDVTFLSPTDFASGNIQPGQWQDLKIAFSVKKGYKGQEDLPLKLVLSDERERFNKELPLNIKLKRSYPKTELVDIKGKRTPQMPVLMPSFGDELLAIPSSKYENRDGVAVVIGVQNYKDKDVPSVEYALNDAQLFKDYLQTALGYREGNIIYLENATKADLEKVFGTSDNHAGQLSDYVKKDKSDVFVYYTGHGAPDLQTKQAYLVPADADPNYVKLGGYALEVFYDNLSRLPARHINVVLDACFSGRSDKGMIISKASPLMIAPILPGSDNIDVFSSSKADEISSWYPEKRHSLFTYFFLKGLQGAADKNKDRAITAAELDEYVAENVPYYARRLYGRKQTPAFTGQEDRVVSRY